MTTSIVLGLGFGDEGKGRTVSYLASSIPRSLVVRFNGGHQAGHTVVHNGVRHVFSSFGSGTLEGAPTLWSKNCTFYPTAVMNEYELLKSKAMPRLYVDPLCPVTTPFDVYMNHLNEQDNHHGSVGVGFGTTVERHESYYKLFFQDLFYDSVLNAKLDLIQYKYYGFDGHNWEMERKQFLRDVDSIRSCNWLRPMSELNLKHFDQIIFEGAQGILLDMDFGFFPNVTRSNTTSKNALELIKEWLLVDLSTPEIYYVTRAYQTRHGAGFMTNENPEMPLDNNSHETNSSTSYQGRFRIGKLDPQLIKYALQCDNTFSKGLKKHLVVTCMDQIVDKGNRPLDEIEVGEFRSLLLSYGRETSAMKTQWGA